jgi:phosphoribosylformimino-5-aminoimidazole carboxamide ribotide isomerase
MKIYPAIDLKSGECVRLYKGCFDQVTTYQKDPLATAQSFAQQGAEFLHIVDLDGAKNGSAQHTEIILTIAQSTKLCIQTGGGIRTTQQINTLLQGGIARVILGSIAIENPQQVSQWLQEFGGEKIVLALDIRMNDHQQPQLASHGWLVNNSIHLWQLLENYQDCGLKHILCTDIDRDGTLQGPNLALYQESIQRYPAFNFQASGGISNLEDLAALAKIPVSGAVIGKALYEKKFTLQEAIAAC